MKKGVFKLLCLFLFLFSSLAFSVAEEEYKDTRTGRIRIGFTEFKNKANAVQKTSSGYRQIQFDLEAFTTMVETALVKTRRFEVIERTSLDEILSEQGLSATGIVNEDTGAISGYIRGVDYLLIGTVTKCGFSSNPVQVGKFKQEKTVIELGVDFRLTDVSTGRIVLSDFVDVNDEAMSQISGNGYSSASANENYIANAMRKASLQAAFLIANAIVPLKIDAIQPAKKIVKLNYGDGFIEKGQYYRLFPSDDTGDSWDASFDEAGKIKITTVNGTYAVGQLVEGEIENISEGYTAAKVPPDEEKQLKDLEKLKTRDEMGNRFGY